MSEACEIAQPVDLKLGKVSLFIKSFCYCVTIPALDLCVYFFPTKGVARGGGGGSWFKIFTSAFKFRAK